ncbi:uncharacterized protein PHACADRAFT_137870 [Phanerochaete carnosa HHB-10118-sp]|uniref:NADH dehydrogenase [ubiquinone] 1 alpha subcomplex assembly factor 3 n=1 Tax=Phanerochaete carnosa (strain HHB-10118-sp) TaxID=650164 RepID=K5X9Y7_PHACS|nr:uncharacterized protein PHACADRAFT_137870 [Phanerochaete carnosa HHB-10118-sp]EKM59727.1 hypothetical protein PHACADRAFT_137870 [Phanerochaete carnosa HHB-10118-sp]
MFSRSSRLAVRHIRQHPLVARPSLRAFTATPTIRTGDSPTKFANILAGANTLAVQIKTVNSEGIQLEDGLIIPSACLFIEGKVFLWNAPPTPWDDWKPEHFEVFDAVIPKPELVLLGTGQRVVPPPPHIRQYLSQIGIQIEVMDTRNACSTYNLLAEEGRRVAAALLPPTPQAWK